jgi:dTDP-4-dehydrorhamnose reductase
MVKDKRTLALQEVILLGSEYDDKSKSVLVVGANSQIGTALIKHLRKESYSVFGTTRNFEKEDKQLLYFDLSEPDFNIDFSKYECVIICSAMTNIAQCESEPEKCEKINSINTIALIEKCVASNCFVIFLSSNAVFDGKKSFYKHTEMTNPITKYGEFKLNVEKYIQNLPQNNACALRLTKVITDRNPFIQKWKAAAVNGNEIKAFSNRLISPIEIKDVVDSIQLLIERKKSGIFQLGSNEEISFFEYAKKIFASEPSMLSKIVSTYAAESTITTHSSLATFLPYSKCSFSFEGSDLIVSSLLRNVSRGKYIDVGANHPTIQNNTNYFYQKGWCGLAIDGNEEFEILWKKNRPRDIFLTELISDSIKEVEFSIYPDDTLSSMDSSAIQRYEGRYAKNEILKRKVVTTTLEKLKNKYFQEQEIHLLSIDIEGEDFNCLVGANLEFWKPGVIVIETKNLSLYKISGNEIVDYLTSCGYRLVAKTPLDTFFIYPQKNYLQWIPKSII